MSGNDNRRYVWSKGIPLQHSWRIEKEAKIHGYEWIHQTKVISQTLFERGSTSISYTTACMYVIVKQLYKWCSVAKLADIKLYSCGYALTS